MSDGLSESRIVKAVAGQAIKQITRKVIVALQKMNVTLSGDHSGLITTWDEICVQLQYEESYSWEVYDETVQTLVGFHVGELPPHEKAAIWLQTEQGFDWEWEVVADREPDPVCAKDIAEHITTQFIYPKAERWSNRRIRAYLERSHIND